MSTIDVPEELLQLLKLSRLGERVVADQVRTVLAIHLFQEHVISVGKAASLAGESRIGFELLLAEIGIPIVRYDLDDYRQEMEAFERTGRE